MREIICGHIGQAGVQISSTVWETFCTEHGIQADGALKNGYEDDENQSFRAFFQEIPSGQFVPRAISIDLEPSVLDEIRTGPYRKLFHPDMLVTGCEDAANNFARGHFTIGKNYIDYTINRVRKIVEMCGSLEGFFIFNSFGGGTGSGFSALMLERLNVEFTKKVIYQSCVFPSDRLATSTVEPYNTLLCTTALIDHTDLCGTFDNESLYDICCGSLDIPRPTYSGLNRIVAQITSALSTSVRFEGTLNADISQIITNLVPYPRIHFPIFTYAPLLSSQKALHQNLTTSDLTRAAFDSSNQLVSCNLSEGRFMCCCLQYRGNVTPKEVNESLFEIKRRSDIKFVEWCPTSFKLGINSQPPPFVTKSEIAQTDKSVAMLTNSSAIAQKFRSLLNKFEILFSKRSFLHWYVGEGMEEAEIMNSFDEMRLITLDYEELSEEDDAKEKVNEEELKQEDDVKNISTTGVKDHEEEEDELPLSDHEKNMYAHSDSDGEFKPLTKDNNDDYDF